MTNKRFIILALVVGAAGFFGGLYSSWQSGGQVATAQASGRTVLKAKRFVITDSNEKPRVIMATNEQGNMPILALYDADTNPREVFSLSGNEEPAIAMSDGNGKLRITVVALDKEGPVMEFYDKDENMFWTIPGAAAKKTAPSSKKAGGSTTKKK